MVGYESCERSMWCVDIPEGEEGARVWKRVDGRVKEIKVSV